MKLRLLPIAAALCLSIVISAGPGFAQAEEIKPEPEWHQRPPNGWVNVAKGVLQRTQGGRVETFSYGEEGLRWTARKLEARIERLEEEYAHYPSGELVGILQSFESHLLEMEEVLASGAARVEAVSSAELAACVFDGPPPTVTAGPKTGSDAPGVKANATISFHSSCGGIGNSSAYAYARATTAGGVMTNDPQEDTKYDSAWPVIATASASASGSLDCFSEAYALAWSSDFTIYYEVDPPPNYSCPLPVTASISGPSEVLLVGGCKTVTWSASATGGSGAYSYKWYLGTGTIVVSARSSYSRTYCQATQVDLRVVATDTSSPANTDDATFSTWIH